MTQTIIATDEVQNSQSMTDLYDLLMYSIEPELMSAIIPQLDALYTNETKKERKARIKRYEKAFALFDERFERLFGMWKDKVLEYKNQVIKDAQKKSTAEDQLQLTSLEHSFRDK